eukprot:2384509-Prymnesium_polylepis.1
MDAVRAQRPLSWCRFQGLPVELYYEYESHQRPIPTCPRALLVACSNFSRAHRPIERRRREVLRYVARARPTCSQPPCLVRILTLVDG